MDGKELEAACMSDQHIKKYYRGIYAIDTLPKRLNANGIFLCNTSPIAHEGRHWFCLHTLQHDVTVVFDSYGHPPATQIWTNLFSHGKIVYYSDVRLQELFSQVCGHYVLYTCALWARGYSMLDILLQHYFDPSETLKNDSLVHSVISSRYDVGDASILIPEIKLKK